MRGISALRIVIERLDEDARACNVTEAALDAAVRLPVSNSRLPVSDLGPGQQVPWSYVAVTVIRMSNGLCVASYDVSIKRYSKEFGDTVAVWSKSGLMTGP